MMLAVAVFGHLIHLLNPSLAMSGLHQVLAGAVLFGAFFIATDPVSSPMTARGKFAFGCGAGFIVAVIRAFSGYPEGVMFAVLLMNAVTPLINRWTVPTPLGGPVPLEAPKA